MLTTRSVRAALTGAFLAAIAVGLLGTLGPLTPFPHISYRRPLASWRALAAAPTGSGTEVFTVTAITCTMCIALANLRSRREG